MPGSNQGRKWEAAVAALLNCATLEQAATQARVSLKTLQRWLKEPAFLDLYRKARRAIVENAVTRLQQLTLQATLALHRNLSCGNASVEVGAATAILEHAARGLETFDLADQIARLEQQLAEVVAHGNNGRAQTAGRPLNGTAPPPGPGRPAP
jgi:hypothetical protein